MPLNKGRKANRKGSTRSLSDRTVQPGAEYAAKTKAVGKGYLVSGSYKKNTKVSALEEPLTSYTSRIRAIGNSKGVILNNQLIESAGLNPDMDILIEAAEGIITIMQIKDAGVNTDITTWDKQFKNAIKKGAKPGGDLFEGMKNDFDEKEW
jgi:antitoxin component of MazEF toxin-antitoxin module